MQQNFKINGIPVPHGTTLDNFINQTAQNALDYNLALLASPYMNNPNNEDTRLYLFENMLDPISLNPAGYITANTPQKGVIDLVNLYTHGPQLAKEASQFNPPYNTLPLPDRMEYTYNNTGLPLWFSEHTSK